MKQSFIKLLLSIFTLSLLFVFNSTASASRLVNWSDMAAADLGSSGLVYQKSPEEGNIVLADEGFTFSLIPCGNSLIADFGAERGIYRYDYNPDTDQVTQTKITSWGNARHLKTGKSYPVLFADFGPDKGLYLYSFPDNSWQWISNWGGVEKVFFSEQENAQYPGIICDFGADKGVYKYNLEENTWNWLTNWTTKKTEVLPFMKSNPDTEFIAEFESGIYSYKNGSWNWLTNWSADEIEYPVFDFGENGLYYTSGSNWNFMSSWDAEDIFISMESGLFISDFGSEKGLYAYYGIDGWEWINNGGSEKIIERFGSENNNSVVIDYGKNKKIYSYSKDSGVNEISSKGGIEDYAAYPMGTMILDLGFGRGIDIVLPDNTKNHVSDLTTQRPEIPDTGVRECYDTGSIIPCPEKGEEYFGQDASYTINKPSYTKLDAQGNELPDSATEWTMVRDNVTGLVWEVKNSKDGNVDYSNPHDADNKYTWYDSNPETNGGSAGYPEDGTDTEDFINTLNSNNFGGHSDWRMPTREELRSISNFGKLDPAVDTDYFPEVMSESYWSSTSVAYKINYSWVDYFLSGFDFFVHKSKNYYTRAVRGEQNGFKGNLEDNGNGTLSDKNSGLMWSKDTADINNNGIIDFNDQVNWKEALAYCENLNKAGYSDWRLPTHKELCSIIDLTTYSPAIKTEYFPDTISSNYWSSTTFFDFIYDACVVFFGEGFDGNGNKSNEYYVRPVRGGVQR